MKNLNCEIEGHEVKGVYVVHNGTVWAHVNGETFTWATSQRASRGSSAKSMQSGAPGQILAPMPGKITKILVKSGTAVKAGQVLLVMEAMKMEYTLKAPVAGVLAELTCSEGDQVTLGASLAKVESA